MNTVNEAAENIRTFLRNAKLGRGLTIVLASSGTPSRDVTVDNYLSSDSVHHVEPPGYSVSLAVEDLITVLDELESLQLSRDDPWRENES